MSPTYVIVVSYTDRSGLMQAFGTYPTEQHATKAIGALRAQPLYAMAGGHWEVLPCYPTGRDPAP